MTFGNAASRWAVVGSTVTAAPVEGPTNTNVPPRNTLSATRATAFTEPAVPVDVDVTQSASIAWQVPSWSKCVEGQLQV